MSGDDVLDQEVISYGSDYSIDVASDGAFEIGPQLLRDVPGGLWLSEVGWFMLVASNNIQYSEAPFSFADGTLGRGPKGECARFTKWALSLATSDPLRRNVLLKFEYAPKTSDAA